MTRMTRELATAIAGLTDKDQFDTNQFKLDLFEREHEDAKKRRGVLTPSAELAEKKRRASGIPSGKKSRTLLPLSMRTLDGALKILFNLGYNYVVESRKDPADVHTCRWEEIQFISDNAPEPKAKKKVRTYKYKRGYLRSYVEPFLKPMQIGDCIEIPAHHPDGTLVSLYSLQSAACSTAFGMWGRGTVTTAMNPKTKRLEVLRIL